jgi:hypothetical protein
LLTAGLEGDPRKADIDIDGDLGRCASFAGTGWGAAIFAVKGHDLDLRRQNAWSTSWLLSITGAGTGSFEYGFVSQVDVAVPARPEARLTTPGEDIRLSDGVTDDDGDDGMSNAFAPCPPLVFPSKISSWYA